MESGLFLERGFRARSETLEMYEQSYLMLDNEVQELTAQLRKARQDIFGLVEMHAAEAKECAKLALN
ncbi:protein of unknown function [Pseudomonas mediterranea]|jgi:hypothetical protein